jgi:hydroxypyruvate isomerase
MKFHANTGFLFPALPFPDRIRAAAQAGFDGIEFHDEIQRHDAAAIADLLAETGLEPGGLNIRMGETAGCAAIPGQEAVFAADMQAAHEAAHRLGTGAIHVLAGRGVTDRATYLRNLRRALDLTDRMILIEPISRAAMAGYHLATLADALEVIAALGSSRIRVMFDWYHIVAESGPAEAQAALLAHRAQIGHVQAASHPARAEPEPELITATAAAGFARVGLEYRPTIPEGRALAALRA